MPDKLLNTSDKNGKKNNGSKNGKWILDKSVRLGDVLKIIVFVCGIVFFIALQTGQQTTLKAEVNDIKIDIIKSHQKMYDVFAAKEYEDLREETIVNQLSEINRRLSCIEDDIKILIHDAE